MTKTYTQIGGGGITCINKWVATNTFTVSVSQEECIDKITYALSVDGEYYIKTLTREVNAVTPRQK